MACPVLTDSDVTRKIENFIPRCPKRAATERVIEGLTIALGGARVVGADIHDAVLKLLASTKRRAIELEIERLPDITDAAEAA